MVQAYQGRVAQEDVYLRMGQLMGMSEADTKKATQAMPTADAATMSPESRRGAQ